MDNSLYIAVFIFGAAAGAMIGYCIGKHRGDNTEETEENDIPNQEFIEVTPYKDIVSNYSTRQEDKSEKSIYIIPPEMFGEKEGYDNLSLTYYSADGILADDNLQIIRDVESIVGDSALESFGEYEDDSVFVRNDILKTDYEILLDLGSYEDVLKAHPYLSEEL